MENVFIKKELSTPEIILDAQTGYVCFEGKSRPEDPDSFFVPITNWLIDYVKEPAQRTIVDFKFSYFNTSSSKKIIEILMIFDILYIESKNIEMNWYYKKSDEDMLEEGEMFNELNQIPMKFISF